MKKEEIVKMINEVTYTPKAHIATIPLLEEWCKEYGYQLVKEKAGSYYLREKEVVEDWTLPFEVEEMSDEDTCDTLYLLERETGGTFDLHLYAFLRKQKDGKPVDFGAFDTEKPDWIIDLDYMVQKGVIRLEDGKLIMGDYSSFRRDDSFYRTDLSRQAKFICYVNGEKKELRTDKRNYQR